MEFLKRHFDFKLYGVTWLSFLIAIAIIPLTLFLPEYFGYENGLLENIQLVILFAGLWLSFSSKTDKKLFVFAGLVITILILREVNCGRTLFFAIPDTQNAFYSWKEIKYGYLAHPLFGIYIAGVVLYFVKNKLFINLWNIIKTMPLPVWNILFMIAGIFIGLYAEHCMENMVLEEITELLAYTSFVGIIYITQIFLKKESE